MHKRKCLKSVQFIKGSRISFSNPIGVHMDACETSTLLLLPTIFILENLCTESLEMILSNSLKTSWTRPKFFHKPRTYGTNNSVQTDDAGMKQNFQESKICSI